MSSISHAITVAELLKYFFSTLTVGRPIAVPPSVQRERVAALREALAATLKDPGFIEEAGKISIEISPTSGPDFAEAMTRLSKLPEAFFNKVSAAQE